MCSNQMPPQKNENSGQATATVNFKRQSQSTFLKGNYMLSMDQATVMTTALSQNSYPPRSLEFVFKSKGIQEKLNPPKGVTVQWAENGFYKLEQFFKFVSTLNSQPVLFSHYPYTIFTLDNYSVYLCPELKAALYKKDTF